MLGVKLHLMNVLPDFFVRSHFCIPLLFSSLPLFFISMLVFFFHFMCFSILCWRFSILLLVFMDLSEIDIEPFDDKLDRSEIEDSVMEEVKKLRHVSH